MKEIATERGVPVFQPASINAPEGVAMLRGLNPDLLVVAAYGQILSKEVLSIPTRGAINVHGSLLPKYRGAAPVAWALLNGESETGVTIIRMSAGLDAGDMLAKVAIRIGDETAGDLEVKLAPIGARLAIETIDRLKAGPVTGEKQDPALVTKAPKLTKEMGLIDWTKSAEQVCRQVRAMQPWPTAYTFLHRQGKPAVRVIVNRVHEGGTITIHHDLVMGEALATGQTLAVMTWFDGLVAIDELQPAGKTRMTAAEFLRGHPLKEGDRFGPEVL